MEAVNLVIRAYEPPSPPGPDRVSGINSDKSFCSKPEARIARYDLSGTDDSIETC